MQLQVWFHGGLKKKFFEYFSEKVQNHIKQVLSSVETKWPEILSSIELYLPLQAHQEVALVVIWEEWKDKWMVTKNFLEKFYSKQELGTTAGMLEKIKYSFESEMRKIQK